MRPDWAPPWWHTTDLHHTLAQSIERIGRHQRTHPGLLATALEQEAAYLHASVSRCARARPTDRTEDEGAPLDADLEDRHHAWIAAGRPLPARTTARRLAQLLDTRRHRLRTRWPDGRPYTEAA